MILHSGGGFSDIYEAPEWQVDFINAYFTRVEGTDKMPYKGYNRYGRGYPDVSALADNYVVVVGDEDASVAGT